MLYKLPLKEFRDSSTSHAIEPTCQEYKTKVHSCIIINNKFSKKFTYFLKPKKEIKYIFIIYDKL